MAMPKWQVKELAFLLKTYRNVAKRKPSYQRNKGLQDLNQRIKRIIKGE